MLKRKIEEKYYFFCIPITKNIFRKLEWFLSVINGETYFDRPFWIPKRFLEERFGFFAFKRKNSLAFTKNTIRKQFIYSTKSLSSFDYQINEKGGIVDCNGNVHTTSQSYKNFLKDNDLVIKDWSDGSNKPKQQLSDRAEIARIVNKYV